MGVDPRPRPRGPRVFFIGPTKKDFEPTGIEPAKKDFDLTGIEPAKKTSFSFLTGIDPIKGFLSLFLFSFSFSFSFFFFLDGYRTRKKDPRRTKGCPADRRQTYALEGYPPRAKDFERQPKTSNPPTDRARCTHVTQLWKYKLRHHTPGSMYRHALPIRRPNKRLPNSYLYKPSELQLTSRLWELIPANLNLTPSKKLGFFLT